MLSDTSASAGNSRRLYAISDSFYFSYCICLNVHGSFIWQHSLVPNARRYLRNRNYVPCFYGILDFDKVLNDKIYKNNYINYISIKTIGLFALVRENEKYSGTRADRFPQRSPKLSRVFLYLNRNSKNMFSISFRNTAT